MKELICKRNEIHRGALVLVNGSHPLRDQGMVELAPVDESRPEILLARRAALLLLACVGAVGGRGEIVPVSGWRSREEQQEIWDSTMEESGEEFTRKYVALPGCSEHQTGLAIDLGRAAREIDFIRPAFPYDGVCGAFRRAAAQYGFVERYPRGKEGITGIGHEPWHFRYVGAPHAALMEQNGLCLEEYLPFLREGERTCALPDGRTARVRHIPARGEETAVPVGDGCWQVSGDNEDGFIVTLWGRTA